jgi:hypothetical protein
MKQITLISVERKPFLNYIEMWLNHKTYKSNRKLSKHFNFTNIA